MAGTTDTAGWVEQADGVVRKALPKETDPEWMGERLAVADPNGTHREAEGALIAAVLSYSANLEDPDVMMVRPKDFGNLEYRNVWKGIQELKAEGKQVGIGEVMLRYPALAPELTGSMARYNSTEAGGFARAVLLQSAKRHLVNAASQAIKMAPNGLGFNALRKAMDDFENGRSTTLECWTAPELFALVPEESPWLLPNLILKGGLNLLAGEVASGKTWLALDLAIALASGGPCWGRRANGTCKVLYLGNDNKFQTMARRMQWLIRGRQIQPPPGLLFNADTLNLASPEGRATLVRKIESDSVEMVIVDVLSTYMQGVDENAAGEVVPVLAELRNISNRHGTTFLIIHHLNKGKGQVGALLERIRGSIGIPGGTDTALVLRRKGDELDAKRVLAQKKNREGEEEGDMEFSIGSGQDGGLVLLFGAHVNAERNILATATAEALQTLKKAGRPLSRAAIGKALEDEERGLGRRSLEDVLKRLADMPGVHKVEAMGKATTWEWREAKLWQE